MARKPEQTLTLANGNEGVRRYRTDYWYDRRRIRPSTYSRGFPKLQDGSIEGAGRIIHKGWCSQIACFDRVTGRYVWTVTRGEKVPGTQVYNALFKRGGPED